MNCSLSRQAQSGALRGRGPLSNGPWKRSLVAHPFANENGTILERQFLLRGLFVEIFSGRAFATRARPPTDPLMTQEGIAAPKANTQAYPVV